MPSELSVKEILQPKILSCTPDTPLASAAQSMVEARCSSILVVAEGKAVGIWTERRGDVVSGQDAGHRLHVG